MPALPHPPATAALRLVSAALCLLVTGCAVDTAVGAADLGVGADLALTAPADLVVLPDLAVDGACAAAGRTTCGSACVDVATDVGHCGGCDQACTPAHATPACAAGHCRIDACAAGFGDCDRDAADGCEVALESDALHCGACGAACSQSHIAATCVAAQCAGACEAGFADCDADLRSDGCEVHVTDDPSNCGGCGGACSQSHVAAPLCAGGACAGACEAGFADCDGNLRANGCEVDIATDVASCGACGAACQLGHATPACTGGLCAVAACAQGYADCDGLAGDGCEVDLQGDPQNCSACSVACAPANATPSCAMGACAINACSAGFADCNHLYGDGCEVSLETDKGNCGACGTVCALPHASPSCVAGACLVAACSGAWLDCDKQAVNGCEVNGSVDRTSCGACGVACGQGEVCSQGVCAANPGGPIVMLAPRLSYLHWDGLDAVADLDGDGRADLVGHSGSTLVTLLGLPGGALGAPQTTVTAANFAGPITPGDFDGDGLIDAAFVDGSFNPQLFIGQGKGDGTFNMGMGIATGVIAAQGAAALDLDGDGKLDLCIAGSGPASLLGKGDGTFGAAQPLNGPAVAVVGGDVDKDGKLDLVTIDGLGHANVWRGNGDGTFAAPVQQGANLNDGWSPTPLLRDFDGDGWPDVAGNANAFPAGNVLVAVNDQKGGFPSSAGILTDSSVPAIASADFDGDKLPDLVALDRRGLRSDLVVLRNTGGAAFAAPVRIGVGDAAATLFPGDIDGDGRIDLAVGLNSVAVVVLGNGDGSFRVPQRSLAQSPLGYLRAADLDGDGDLDLVGTTLTNADSYLNAGDGTFTFVASYKIDGVVWDHQLADLDGDSRPDLLAVAYNGDVVVHLGQGDGTFGPEARTASVGSATALGVGDFDGDGAVDVLTAGSPCGFLKGDGKGGFAAAVGLKGSGAAQVLPLDADGDGKLDFVTDEDQVWLGNGDGSFSAGAAVPNPGWAYAMAAGDCDSDGDLDLMYVDNWPQIMVNDGKGGFSAGWKPMSPGPTMRAVAAADLDGDGNVDFVVSRDGRTCSAYRGLGDCTFVDGGSWTPGCQLALDFDGDGLPDLAQTADSGDILVTFNRSR